MTDSICISHQFKSKSHWIFDLDGTLTEPVHDFAFICRELDIPPGADILGHLDCLPEPEASRRHARLQEIELDLARKAEPATGALEVLERLHCSGAQLGILTRNDRDIALLTLDAIGAGDILRVKMYWVARKLLQSLILQAFTGFYPGGEPIPAMQSWSGIISLI